MDEMPLLHATLLGHQWTGAHRAEAVAGRAARYLTDKAGSSLGIRSGKESHVRLLVSMSSVMVVQHPPGAKIPEDTTWGIESPAGETGVLDRCIRPCWRRPTP
jgi:hypothetical protein